MDHSKIYKYRFDELLRIIRHRTEFHDFTEREDDQIIDICGNEFRDYQKMISYNESWVIYTVIKIITGIFDQEGISYSIPKYEEKRPNGETQKTRPFAFTIKENNRTFAYIILYRLKKGFSDIREINQKYKGVDGVRFCFLQRNYQDEIDMLNDLERREGASFLEFYSIKDFFDQIFGENEFLNFVRYAEEFSERARGFIGFKIVAMPTEEAIKRFKRRISNLLEVKDYSILLPNTIGQDDRNTIITNYVTNNRYMIMTGNSDFADSFVSSEWYYGIHTVTGSIDQTGLVTGYLKSVEQLLYALIRLSINKNRRISINSSKRNGFSGVIYGDKYIDYTESNEPYADTTLGSLIRFVKSKNKKGDFFNADLFDASLDPSTIQIIIDALYAFKDSERNDHLHKDNLYTSQEVENIRNKAISLYCLLIGSFRMNNGEYTKLISYDTREIVSSYLDEEALTELIIEWAVPILMFDMPKESHTVAFYVTKDESQKWSICLFGLKNIPDEKYDSLEWKNQMVYSSLLTRNVLMWESSNEYHIEIERVLRALRRIINGDNDMAVLLKQHKEVIIGDLKVIEVLYS